MNLTVEFIEVGRDKRTWTEVLRANPLDCDDIEAAVERAVSKSRALMSRDITAVMTDVDRGDICAGMRTVGTFRIDDTPRMDGAR